MNPTVSIVIPCYNEARTIGGLLDAIRAQTIGPDRIEVIIADGGSIDGTREIIRQFDGLHTQLEIRIVDNLAQTIPAALNTAVSAASGDVIVRLDAHSKPAPDYVERCLETLERTNAANVGGRWQIEASRDTIIARSIAAAASHLLGAGGASYRIGGPEGPADTVPFGCFRREWLERVGPFSDDLLTNEDYEYNVRLRGAGGLVWFNPAIQSTYFARATFAELAAQYARYGYWKAQMLRRFPSSIQPRQILPPLFVLSLLILVPLSFLVPAARLAIALVLGAYAIVILVSAMVEAIRSREPGFVVGFSAAVVTMHLAWGGAFLWGVLRKSDRKPAIK